MTPIIGGIVEMVKDPYGFWERQRLYSFPGMSWNSIVGIFTVFVTDPALSRYVFSHNSSDSLLLALHPNGERSARMPLKCSRSTLYVSGPACAG